MALWLIVFSCGYIMKAKGDCKAISCSAWAKDEGGVPQPWDPHVQEHLGCTRGSRLGNCETEAAEVSTQIDLSGGTCAHTGVAQTAQEIATVGWGFNSAWTNPKSCFARKTSKWGRQQEWNRMFLHDLPLGLLSSQRQKDQCFLGRLRMATGTRCRSCSIRLWDATTGQRGGHICVSMSPAIQPDSPFQQGACWGVTGAWVREESQKGRKSFLTQKRHL